MTVDENDKAEINVMLAFVEVGPTSSGSTKLEDIVEGIEDLIPEQMFDEFNEGDDEEQLHIFVEICDYLNGVAPEGVSFGASEGDGACFGFWKDEEDGIMLNTKDMKMIQDRRDIISDAITRIDGDLNFGTTVKVDGQTYHVTIVQED